MIYTAVFEQNKENRDLLREWIVRYLIRSGREMDLLWFTTGVTGEKLKKYAKKIDIALISLEKTEGIKAGQLLYRENPECRICYYSSAACDLEPLLSTRPAAFFLKKRGEAAFAQTLGALLEELTEARDIFFYEGKTGMYCIPLARILYLQSDLKYVLVHVDGGEDIRFFSRLSQVEDRLDGRFVRIHKSYIVNSGHVKFWDKKLHTVHLSNGESIPISDAQYEGAAEKLRKLRNGSGSAQGESYL